MFFLRVFDVCMLWEKLLINLNFRKSEREYPFNYSLQNAMQQLDGWEHDQRYNCGRQARSEETDSF